MIITEKKNIVGKLIAQGQAYDMLELFPHRRTELLQLREHVFQFLVVVNGFAQPIIVARGGFVIIPSLEVNEQEVKFIEEGDDLEGVQILDDEEIYIQYS